LGVKSAGSGNVSIAAGFTKLNVEPGEQVCSARDTTVTASEERLGQEFFRPNEQRPVRAVFQQADGITEIAHAPRTILETDDTRHVHGPAKGFQSVLNLG